MEFSSPGLGTSFKWWGLSSALQAITTFSSPGLGTSFKLRRLTIEPSLDGLFSSPGLGTSFKLLQMVRRALEVDNERFRPLVWGLLLNKDGQVIAACSG